MDTLPGHFIRYISAANGVVGEYTRLRVWTHSVFRNAFLQILVVNIGYCYCPLSQTGLHILTDSIFSFLFFLHRAAATWLIVRTSNDAFYLINN